MRGCSCVVAGSNAVQAVEFKVAVFDLDGTLIDTMPGVFRAYEYALAPYRPLPSRAEIAAVLGGPGRRGLAQLLPPGAPVEEAWQRLWQYAFAHRHEVELMPHARALLQALRDAGKAVGLWTGRDRESTQLIFQHYGLAPYFDGVVCGDDLPSHKPDPEGLFTLLRGLGAEAEDAVFVGDTIHDVRAGLNAGVFTVAVGEQAHLLEVAPDVVVRDLVELHALLLPGA